ncbi:MAG: histone deacetylase [Myxococcales bacterium]|nr:histone deacetylase [Myxococcales bacterium]
MSARHLFLVDDPLFDEHRARGYHPERPERLLAARHAISHTEQAGVRFERLAPRDATATEVARVHDDAYVDVLEAKQGLFGALDEDTFLGPRSVAAAYRAAGGALALVDAILDGAPGSQRGVAIVRPPGHHARPDRGMGFCLLNNVALAAAHARSRGIGKVAIVDWDVHHGNGTQEAFFRDPNVLFVSLHQYPFYPGTGASSELGAGEGTGFNINVPLSADAGDSTYRAAFERIVLPVLEQYAPELVLVSAGFDAHARDPLAGMAVTSEGFRAMATSIGRIADKTAGGRVGVFLEGGYDLEGIESSLGATLEALTAPPQTAPESSAPYSTRHGFELERARRDLANHWKL